MSSCEGNSEESLVYREEYLNTPGQVASVSRLLHFPTRVLLSHRKLSVFLAVSICLVTSSLIVFFLFPRTIAVQPVGLNSSTVAIDEANVYLNITVGGCLCPWAPTPPSRQHSSEALVLCSDLGHGQPGILRHSEDVRSLGRSP